MLNPSWEEIEAKATPKTKAVIFPAFQNRVQKLKQQIQCQHVKRC